MKVNVVSESAFTVQGHGVHTAFTETVDLLRNRPDVEVVTNSREPADIIHIHTVGPYSLQKLLWGKGAKIVSAHVTPDSFVGSLVGAKYWYGLACLYLRWFYNRADAVLAVSEETQVELARLGVEKPVYVVPNTIKTDVFKTTIEAREAVRGRLGIAPGRFVVMCSGQVQPRKRIDIFIAAAEVFPQMRFVWVGGVPFKKLGADSQAMNQIMEHHPANVTITGTIPREQVIPYYQAADLFFLPSEQETFGIVIVEAAAAGLPLLLRDLDQYRQTFAGGYEHGTDATFVAQIQRFSTDKAYGDQWRLAAAGIAQRYDVAVGTKMLMDIYIEVLDLKAGPKLQTEA